ncbi:histidine kinase, partial [Streptomyces sp. NPDC005899]
NAGRQGPGLPNQGRPEAPRQGGGLSGAFGGARTGARGQQDPSAGGEPGGPNLFGHSGPGQPGRQSGPPTRQAPQPQQAQGGFQQPGGPGRQLPPSGGPRAELPGADPQRPQSTSWGVEEQGMPRRTPLDSPRGHEDPDAGRFGRPGDVAGHQPFSAPDQRPGMNDRQGPGATAEFARPDFSAPQAPQMPQPQQSADPASTAQFARPDFGAPRQQQDQGFGRQDEGFGQQQAPQHQQMPSQRRENGPDFGAPRPPAPSAGEPPHRPALPQQPEALPPAGPGDGRTPLYDTLETNWFHGPQQGGQQPPAAEPQAPAAPGPAAHQAPPAPRRGAADTGSWRASPNDELVRQAERVKKPAAGGITTSGLPRRVPRANLVPGTAQQQNHQSGPQVSRAPDDVRGRLTNLRRGIQQGRQANNGPSTGSFQLGPTHQQER